MQEFSFIQRPRIPGKGMERRRPAEFHENDEIAFSSFFDNEAGAT